MPTYVSNKLLVELQEQTESFLNKAISEWQMIRHSQFGHKTAPDKWSATQCIEHLNSYGRFYLPEMEKAIKKTKEKGWTTSSHFKSGWLGNYFTNLMMPGNDGTVGKKMSSPKNHYPASNADSYKVIAEFIEQQEKLVQLLDAAQEIDLNKTTCAISISKLIKLKLGDTFLFFIAHQYRHILQAERALKAADAITTTSVIEFDLKNLAG
jgi:gamma-glutamylcyclotransferase (GGCT)/AIG2-like uncharacterized protein YtfP